MRNKYDINTINGHIHGIASIIRQSDIRIINASIIGLSLIAIIGIGTIDIARSIIGIIGIQII